MSKQCMECGKHTCDLHDDHRVPPLEAEECLCYDCSEDSIQERIDELQGEIIQLRSRIRRI